MCRTYMHLCNDMPLLLLLMPRIGNQEVKSKNASLGPRGTETVSQEAN